MLEAARAALRRGGRSSSPAPTRSTATRPTACRWSRRRPAGRWTRTHPFAHGIDETMRSTRRMHSHLRRLARCRGRHGAGVRPLLRHEDRVLPRRLPDRSGPRGAELHGFLAYLVRCTAPGRPTRSSATRASRCATTSTADDLVEAFVAVLPSAPRSAKSTTSAAASTPTARCWRRSRWPRRSPAGGSNWTYDEDGRIGRPHAGGSATCRNSGRTTQAGACGMT